MKAVKRGKNTFIHGRAYVAGDVTLEDGANIWCGACIRGDLAPVRIGKNTNVQDNATIHVGYGVPAVLGDHVTVGHNAVVHGAMVGDGTLIPGGKEIPDGSVVFGNPFRIVRQATEAERQGNLQNAAAYLRLAEAFAAAGEGV